MKSSLCLLALASFAHGAVVIDNLNSTTNGFSTGLTGPTAGIPPFFSVPNRQTAFTFTTGSASDELASLEVAISVINNATAISATISTGPSVPGGVDSITIGSVTPTVASGGTTLQFTPSSPIALSANTTYWIHLTVPTGNGYYSVLHADSPTEQLGFQLGESWQYSPSVGWGTITPQARTRITTTAVIPEPGVALASGLGLLLMLRRRRF
ncbi:MAG: hypothetical protein MUF31_05255 [Akkermansiaceae bacterium]|nr:hypothetical protein [Akkermansiaceae bacterium]